jgi:hypothetical protein
MAVRAGNQEQSYSDLRERSKRRERRRDQQVQRIVGVERDRHLHSLQQLRVAATAATAR